MWCLGQLVQPNIISMQKFIQCWPDQARTKLSHTHPNAQDILLLQGKCLIAHYLSVLLLLDGPEDPLPEDVDGVGDAHPPGAAAQMPGLEILHLGVPELLQPERGQVVFASFVEGQEALLRICSHKCIQKILSVLPRGCYLARLGHQLYPPLIQVPISWSGG